MFVPSCNQGLKEVVSLKIKQTNKQTKKQTKQKDMNKVRFWSNIPINSSRIWPNDAPSNKFSQIMILLSVCFLRVDCDRIMQTHWDGVHQTSIKIEAKVHYFAAHHPVLKNKYESSFNGSQLAKLKKEYSSHTYCIKFIR